nr:MAG TPA: hypothetical protein [Caudoviricetes sp.]
MRKKSEITVLVLILEVLGDEVADDTTGYHLRLEDAGNGIPDYQEAEESEHDKEEENEGEHCAFLSELGFAEVRKRNEDSFSTDLFFSIEDFTAGLLLAEDVADDEALCCASLVHICGKDHSTVNDPRNSLNRATESLIEENSCSARSRNSVDKVRTVGIMSPGNIRVCWDDDGWLQTAIWVDVWDGIDDTVDLQSVQRIVNEDSKPTPHSN